LHCREGKKRNYIYIYISGKPSLFSYSDTTMKGVQKKIAKPQKGTTTTMIKGFVRKHDKLGGIHSTPRAPILCVQPNQLQIYRSFRDVLVGTRSRVRVLLDLPLAPLGDDDKILLWYHYVEAGKVLQPLALEARNRKLKEKVQCSSEEECEPKESVEPEKKKKDTKEVEEISDSESEEEGDTPGDSDVEELLQCSQAI